MSYNGSGTFTLVAGNPVVTGTTISSTWANNTLNDIATGLSTAITKDGQTTPTANIPMGGYKITGLAAATANGDAVRFEQASSIMQAQTGVFFTTAGTTTAYTLTPTPAIGSLIAGQRFNVVFNAANTTTTPTLAISGLTAKNLKIYDSGATKQNPAVGSLAANMIADIVYDGTDYVVLSFRFVGPQLGAPVATTSGTEKIVTGIPAWAKRVTVHVMGTSVDGTSPIILQLGISSGSEATGYSGTVALPVDASATAVVGLSVGFAFTTTGSATQVFHGRLTLELADASTNTWTCNGMLGRSDVTTIIHLVAGTKALAGVLDRVRLTTVSGADNFDAGSISVSWE